MLVSEWNCFSQRHLPLRVTVPSDEQKSKYYISIPYHYAIPFLVLTGTFQWLIFDSFFCQNRSLRRLGYPARRLGLRDRVPTLAIILASITYFLLLALLGFKSDAEIQARHAYGGDL